jgi:hypothetical protein
MAKFRKLAKSVTFLNTFQFLEVSRGVVLGTKLNIVLRLQATSNACDFYPKVS